MRIYVIWIIIHLVACREKLEYDSNEDFSSDEEPDYTPHVETTLDFRGKIRQLFAVELGLHARGRNMICSPISAMMPLAKLLIGARKNSKSEKELLAAVGLKHKNELKSVYTQTLKELEHLKGVEISLASRIYLSKKHRLYASFKRKSQDIFGSAVELVDPELSDEVAETVNQWVAEHTKNRITNLISPDEINPSLSLILVNAIYFKGSWLKPFRPARILPFHSPRGTKNVPMVSVNGRFNYFQCDDLNAQIIELPYVGEQAAMIIILPNAKNGLPILLRTLKVSHELLNNALMKMKTAEVDVTIPKFKIETTLDLKSYYKKMGVTYSLSQEISTLERVVKNQVVYISSAIQKAIIEVSEEGTVAAAASVIAVFGSSMTPPIKFKADHPFFIYVKGHHEQLFAGIINSP